jgi:tetratricopeptide (TPR) repeat protein
MNDDACRLEQVFAELVALPDAQRAEALRVLALDNEVLARRVAALLDAHHATAPDLQSLAWRTLVEAGARPRLDLVGRELDGWMLEEELGRGGMGVVYAGRRRRDGIEQRAAIKLLVLPLFDVEAGRRFVREATVLARLDHPAICRLRDWGHSPEGWPYLVLDLVDGEAVDRHAARQPMQRRIELMVAVADAVAAAHRQLVLHLDLKPDNILVDAAGRPVLLDFGVSRVLSDEGGATVTLARWLTPDYASPEQLRGDRTSVASDIYALGAICFELLSGERPFRLAGVPVTEALRRIERGAPPLRGQAISAPRDLEAVIAKAMHADPARRHVSADAFADDLRAVLARRPVSARPDSLGYRLRTLLRRHPLLLPLSTTAVAAITVMAGLLALQTADLVAQRDRAELESERARAATGLLLSSIQAADPARERGAELTLSELLDSTAMRIDSELAATPAVQVAALLQVADVRRSLGQHALALPLYERAQQVQVQLADEDDERRVALLVGKAEALRGVDRVDDALVLLESALGNDEGHWSLHLALANTYLANSRLDEAEASVQLALLAVPASDTLHRAELFQRRGYIAARRERHVEALEWFAKARAEIGPDPARRDVLASLQMEMADSYSILGDHERARDMGDQALAMQREVYGAGHPATVTAMLGVVYVIERAGQWQEALAIANEAIAIERASGSRPSRRLDRLLAISGTLHRSLGDSAAALDAYRASLAIAEQLYPPVHRALANSHALVATALADVGDFEGTLAHYQRSWAIYDELAGADLSRGRATTAINLSSSFRSLGRLEEAIRWGAQALQEAERLYRPDEWILANFRMIQARTLFQAGHMAEAEAMALDVDRVYQASSVPVRPNALRNNAQLLADIYASTGQSQRAEPYLAQLAALASPEG